MSSLPLMNTKGENVGNVEFPDDLIVLRKGDQAVHDAITAYRAGLRAGTASTLTKGSVNGSNSKPWRQKGLGRARAGYKQSPVWRGGGVAFGPHPRSYAKKLPRRVVQLAFCRAFSAKMKDNSVRVVQDLDVGEPKTKLVAELLKSLNIEGSVLILVDKATKNLELACRNSPRVEMALASDVHAYHLVRYPSVIVSREALSIVEQRMKRGKGGAK
jgi:large subunit ribosomal protein L4